MTALCGGGSSGPTFGSAAVVEVSSGLLAVLAAEYGAPWLVPLIASAGLPNLVLSTFCGVDPPAMPTFTQAEADAVLKLTPGADFVSGVSKARDALLNIAWDHLCVCTSGVYTPPPAPVQPAGSITVLQPPPPLNTPCQSDVYTSTFFAGGGSVNRGGFVTPIGLTPKALVYKLRAAYALTPPGSWSWIFEQIDLSGATARTDTYTISSPTTSFDVTVPAVPNLRQTRLTQTYISGSATQSITGTTIEQWCDGPPGSIQTPCCPPDTATAATLQQLLDLVKSQQRAYAPFAYVLGSTHAGLTGLGSIPVQRLLGLKVELTTVPIGARTLPGNPTYVKDMGWVSVSEVDGMIQELRVARTLFTWFPPYMTLADHINFDFFPGVVATITEIQPEP